MWIEKILCSSTLRRSGLGRVGLEVEQAGILFAGKYGSLSPKGVAKTRMLQANDGGVTVTFPPMNSENDSKIQQPLPANTWPWGRFLVHLAVPTLSFIRSKRSIYDT